MEEHVKLMEDLVQKISSELRTGLRPAYDNFMGFFHAIDWKEPWLTGLLAFHIVLLLVVIISRKNTNFQMCLFLLTSIDQAMETQNVLLINKIENPNSTHLGYWKDVAMYSGIWQFLLEVAKVEGILVPAAVMIGERNSNTALFKEVAGVYLAERFNSFLGENWKSFSSQNYFDPSGVFMSVLWSGPLLAIAMMILINTLFSLCYLIVKWKRAELRHRARAARSKEE